MTEQDPATCECHESPEDHERWEEQEKIGNAWMPRVVATYPGMTSAEIEEARLLKRGKP